MRHRAGRGWHSLWWAQPRSPDARLHVAASGGLETGVVASRLRERLFYSIDGVLPLEWVGALDGADPERWVVIERVPAAGVSTESLELPLPMIGACRLAAAVAGVLGALTARGVEVQNLQPSLIWVDGDEPARLVGLTTRSETLFGSTRKPSYGTNPLWTNRLSDARPDERSVPYNLALLFLLWATNSYPFPTDVYHQTHDLRRVDESAVERLPTDLQPVIRAALGTPREQRPSLATLTRALERQARRR